MDSHQNGSGISPDQQNRQNDTHPQGQSVNSQNAKVDPLEAQAQATFDSIIQTVGRTDVLNLVRFLKEEAKQEMFDTIKESTGRDYKDVDEIATTLAEGAKASSVFGNVRKTINEDTNLGMSIDENGNITRNAISTQNTQPTQTSLEGNTAQPDMAVQFAEEAYLNSIPNLEFIKEELQEKSLLTGKSVAALYREKSEEFASIASKRAEAAKKGDEQNTTADTTNQQTQQNKSVTEQPNQTQAKDPNRFAKLGEEIARSNVHPDNIKF